MRALSDWCPVCRGQCYVEKEGDNHETPCEWCHGTGSREQYEEEVRRQE